MPLKVIELDGRAGGQVLRTALALSAVTQKPASIFNIRKNRPNPGLQAQHLTGVQTLAKVCNAKTRGIELKSTKIIFYPKKIIGGNYSVNIGTAGSITLLLQAVMLPSLFSKTPLNLRIFGGTDVAWSPPFNYMKEVLLSSLNQMGAKFNLELKKRGYYPKGRGLAIFSSFKSKLPLKPLYLAEQKELHYIKIISHSANLPKEVALTQASSAKKILSDKLNCDIEEVIDFRETGESEGSGITLIAVFSDGARMGACSLSEKNKPAEKIGEQAAQLLLQEIESKKPVDQFLADQLIPFMALAEGFSTIECSKLTQHCLTNIHVTQKFLDVKFEVKGKLNEPAEIRVQGTGMKRN